MGHSKLTRVPREVALCAAPASTGGFDSSTEHAVLAILVGLLVSVISAELRHQEALPSFDVFFAGNKIKSFSQLHFVHNFVALSDITTFRIEIKN